MALVCYKRRGGREPETGFMRPTLAYRIWRAAMCRSSRTGDDARCTESFGGPRCDAAFNLTTHPIGECAGEEHHAAQFTPWDASARRVEDVSIGDGVALFRPPATLETI